jgi:hypothetical protein
LHKDKVKLDILVGEALKVVSEFVHVE